VAASQNRAPGWIRGDDHEAESRPLGVGQPHGAEGVAEGAHAHDLQARAGRLADAGGGHDRPGEAKALRLPQPRLEPLGAPHLAGCLVVVAGIVVGTL
jgi:hypothetical protein